MIFISSNNRFQQICWKTIYMHVHISRHMWFGKLSNTMGHSLGDFMKSEFHLFKRNYLFKKLLIYKYFFRILEVLFPLDLSLQLCLIGLCHCSRIKSWQGLWSYSLVPSNASVFSSLWAWVLCINFTYPLLRVVEAGWGRNHVF